MHRFFKYSLVSFIAIILITGIIVSAITFHNPNTYKLLITQWVKNEKQRNLTLDGDIKLTFYPQFSLNLSQVSLSEYHSHKEFASIENIYLSMSLWPLFRKQLVIDKLTIEGLDAKLIRFTDGRTNIDDLLSTDENAPPLTFDINRLHIENAALIAFDEKNARNYTFPDLSLTIGKVTNTTLNNLKLHTKSDSDHFEVQLDIPSLQFDVNHISSDKINLIAKITHLENSINGAFLLSGITSTSNHFNSDMVTIKLAAEKDAQIINLFINSPLNGNLSTQELNLSDLELNLRIFQPQSPDRPISGNLQGELSVANKAPSHLQANFTGNLEDSLIQANFNLTDFKKPAFQFSIDIDQFNMDRYLPQRQPKKKQINDGKQPTNHLNESLDLSVLADLNANGTIRIQSFRSNDISVSGMQFEIQSSDDHPHTHSTE